jgi:hypothetical protein
MRFALRRGVRARASSCVLVVGAAVGVAGCGGVVATTRAPATARDQKDGASVIGRGYTSLGARYVATVGVARRPPRPVPSAFAEELEPRGGCPLRVFVEEGANIGADEVCYAPHEVSERAGVQCVGGLLEIHLVAPAATRGVRLRLSDGRRVASSVMFLPRRLGGPAVLYYQVVRSGTPRPVSAAELGAGGEVLATVGVPSVGECTSQLVRSLPGSSVVVKGAPAPDGKTFAIVTQRTRILGRVFFALKVAFEELGGVANESAALRQAPPLEWEVLRICAPSAYGIVYGVLTSPDDEALVQSGDALRPLGRAAIPSSLRAHSVVVYGVLERAPARLIVRAHGRDVADVNVAPILAETRCA